MPDTALALALDQVGDRWSLLVVRALLGGPRRYGELTVQVPGIAPNVLAARLRHLEEQRLLTSAPYQERPRRLAYQLTAPGRELATVLGALSSWGARQHGLPEHRRHDECGTSLSWRPWCPTCGVVVDVPVEPRELVDPVDPAESGESGESGQHSDPSSNDSFPDVGGGADRTLVWM